ncbi:MAG TPA: hypothetical protein VGA05_08450 [Candidatus Bathyarchaeia archaeon]
MNDKLRRILPDQTKPSYQELIEQNQRLIEALEAKRKVSMKITQDGLKLSVYHGHGRFPVTLYREQWEAVLGASEAIKAAIQSLPRKGE